MILFSVFGMTLLPQFDDIQCWSFFLSFPYMLKNSSMELPLLFRNQNVSSNWIQISVAVIDYCAHIKFRL